MPRIVYYLKYRKQLGRNNLVLIFAFYSANVWSTGPFKAGDSILAIY